MAAPKDGMPPTNSPEWIELRFKQMQIELMEEQLEERRDRKARLEHDRNRRYQDFLKAQADLAHRQRVCQHKKGGKNNNFARGNSADYSIIQNTYPNGRICVMCTRCGKEVWQPSRELKASNPKLFAEMQAEWKKWSEFSTDNSPSGSKIFEIFREAA